MNLTPDDAMELGQLLQFLDDWFAADHVRAGQRLVRGLMPMTLFMAPPVNSRL